MIENPNSANPKNLCNIFIPVVAILTDIKQSDLKLIKFRDLMQVPINCIGIKMHGMEICISWVVETILKAIYLKQYCTLGLVYLPLAIYDFLFILH